MFKRKGGGAKGLLNNVKKMHFSLMTASLIGHHLSDMMCFCLYQKCKKFAILDFICTKLPLAETRDPKWRSWWVPDVSVHLFTSGLYLARWIKVTETTEIMPDLMSLIYEVVELVVQLTANTGWAAACCWLLHRRALSHQSRLQLVRAWNVAITQ